MLQLLTYTGNTTRRIFYITHDGGQSWQAAGTLPVEGSAAVTFADANHWYIPAMDEQYKTTMLYVTAGRPALEYYAHQTGLSTPG